MAKSQRPLRLPAPHRALAEGYIIDIGLIAICIGFWSPFLHRLSGWPNSQCALTLAAAIIAVWLVMALISERNIPLAQKVGSFLLVAFYLLTLLAFIVFVVLVLLSRVT